MMNSLLNAMVSHFQRRRNITAMLLSAAMQLHPALSHAAVTVWIGPAGGGDFQNAANWTTNPNPPQTGDLAIIGSVNGTVTYSSSTATLLHTFVNGSNVSTTFDIGAGQSHNTSALFIAGSDAANQDVTVTSGTLNVGTSFFVGSGAAATNCDTVITGAATLVNIAAANTSSGSLLVGVTGDNATFKVQQGATVKDQNPLTGPVGVGFQMSDNSLLTVTDPGSTLSTVGSLQLGVNDPGNADMFNNQVKVLNSGSVTASQMQVGISESAKQNTVTISGTGSIVSLTGSGGTNPVGWRSINNSLIVDNNGLLDSKGTIIAGLEATSTGNSVSVTGGGQVNATGLDMRRGTATITNGAVNLSQYFSAMNNAYVGGKLVANVGSSSIVNFNSGKIQAVGADVNNGSAFNVGNGGGAAATYQMIKDTNGQNGTHAFANGLFLNSNAVLSGNGNIVGDVSAAPGAQVNVGASPGLINVKGAWNNTGASVGLEVGNLATLPALPGVGYDLLDVAGAFTHGGSVKIDVASYVAGSGNVADLKILGWTSEVGSSAATAVSFVGGPALTYQFRSDGLYLTNVSFSFVPEPASFGIMVMGAVVCLAMRRKVR
jgi:hypothetical protein